ncbi:Uridylate kinase, partial [Bienertia sinuspersici]
MGIKKTSFFHAKAQQRRKRNNINKIKDLAGNSYDEEETVTEVFANFFEELFTSGGEAPKVVKELWEDKEWNRQALEALFSSREINVPQKIKMFAWRAVKGGIPNKAQLGRRGLEGKKKNMEDIIHKAIGIVGEYELALESSSYVGQATTWPITLRGVARDWLGDVVVATSKKLLGHYSAETVEAMALRHAMSITMEVGFKNIVVETDNLKLPSHLSKEKTDHLSYGSIIKDIKLLDRECQCISFTFVKREGNKVAHKMA